MVIYAYNILTREAKFEGRIEGLYPEQVLNILVDRYALTKSNVVIVNTENQKIKEFVTYFEDKQLKAVEYE